MALLEEQVVRYSRQILLAQVGGRGQERILRTRVQVLGVGAAQSTAIAYLVAGGCSVSERPRPLHASETGYLFNVSDVGTRADEALARSGYALNPDSVSHAMGVSERHGAAVQTEAPVQEAFLGMLPANFGGKGPWVAIGEREGRGAVLFRGEAGCPDCFHATSRGLTVQNPGVWPELLGALAALCLQRLILGISEPFGGMWVDADARMTPLDLAVCSDCRK